MKSRALKRFCALFLAGALTLTAVQVPSIGANAADAEVTAWTWSKTQSQGGYEKVALESAEADSQMSEPANQNDQGEWEGPASYAIDGRTETYWHSDWTGANNPGYDDATDTLTERNTITVKLESPQTVAGVTYLPRQAVAGNGVWTNFEVQVSKDGKAYESAYTPEKALEWSIEKNDGGQAVWSGDTANQEREFVFGSTYADIQYVKFIIKNTVGAEAAHKHINAGEIGVLKANGEETPDPEKVDKTDLYEAIVKAEALEEGNYAEGWDKLQEALTAAKGVMDKEDATLEEVEEAKTKLDEAVAALKVKDKDRKALEDLVASNADRAKDAYEAAEWTTFEEKLKSAQDTLKSAEATSEQLTTAATELQAAVEALKMKEITVAYDQSDFEKMEIVNEAEETKTDDGNNVQKLIEQKKYDGLFDGNIEGDRSFEFLWNQDPNLVDGKLPDYVTLPVTLRFTLKEASPVEDVILYNDSTPHPTDGKHKNGYITKAKAKLIYADETSEEITIEEEKDAYVFSNPDETKLVKTVEVTPMEAYSHDAQGTTLQMLTITELEIKNVNEVQPEDKAILEETIKDVQNGKIKDDYLKDSWQALEDAMKVAEEVAANEEASKEAIADAVKALRDAEAGLVKKEDTGSLYGQDAFNITITNETETYRTDEDGKNVETLIEQGKYDGLFNGNKVQEGDNPSRDFELKYGVADTANEKIPLTLHLEFKKPSKVSKILLYNANKGNGYVTQVETTVTYNGEESETDEQNLENQATFNFDYKDKADKLVDSIDIEILKAQTGGNDTTAMMTLAELEIYAPYVRATEIKLAEENATTIKVNEKAPVTATVMPEDATDKGYVITSSDEDVVAVETTEDGIQQIIGVAEGYATITATASDDSTVKASYTVKVEGTAKPEPGPGPDIELPYQYKQDDFTITMTNDVLKTDEDGTNVVAMIQQESYDGLFDGAKSQEAETANRDFEFKWDVANNYDPTTGALPDYITLPVTLHLALNTPSRMNKVLVYNANPANGYVTSVMAELFYEDDTSSGKLIASPQAIYEFDFAETKSVERVDITLLTAVVSSTGASVKNMFTLAELELFADEVSTEGYVAASAIKADANNAKEVTVDGSVAVNATVTPDSATDKTYAVQSSDDSIVRIDSTVDEDGNVSYAAVGVAEGKATITVIAADNTALTDSYEINVLPKPVTKEALQAAYDANKDKKEADYTAASWATFKAALDAAKTILDKEDATQDEVDNAASALTSAAAALAEKATEEDLAALQAAIDAGKDLKEADYTAESWAAYKAALEAAQAALEKEDPSKAEINDAAAALEAAQKALVKKNEQEEKFPFVDVKEGDYFYNAVKYVNNNKIMTGVDKTHFAPYDTLVRAQFATTLYRMEGKPDVKYSNTFKDVPDGWFYTEAVLWAAKDNVRVVTGYTNGNFGPNDTITREQMAAMMYRYAKYKEYDVKVDATLDKYPDKDKVSDYAKKAMEWCVGKGIITGKGEKGATKTLDPQGNATRAECATILQRFLKAYAE